MNYLRKIVLSKPFIIAVAAIVVYTLAGFFLVPFLVRHYVPKIAREQLHKQAVIGEVRFNPYIYTLEVNELRVDEPDGHPIVAFKRLLVDFELKSLFKWAWTFRQIGLEGLHVNAVISPEGSLNLAQLAPPSETPPAEEEDKDPPRLIFEDVRIDQGQLEFTDRRQSKPASLKLIPLQLQVKNLTTLLGQEGPTSITALSTDGERLQWTGEIGLNPVASRGTLTIEHLRAATLWEFTRDALNLQEPAGKIAVTVDYSLDLSGEATRATLTNLTLSVTGLALKLEGAKAPFLELKESQLGNGRFDLASRQIEVAKIAVEGGRVRLGVDEQGLNVQRLARPAAPSRAPKPQEKGNSKPWKIQLAAFDLGGFALEYQDLSRTPGLKAGVGNVQVSLNTEVETGASPIKMLVKDIALGLSDVRAGLSDHAEPVLRVDRVGLEGGAAYDLAANALTIPKVSITGGGVDVRRQADGAINLAVLFAPSEKGAIAEERDQAAAEGRPFKFQVKSVALSDLQAGFSDLTVKEDGAIVNLEDISLALTDVDGKSPLTFDLGFKVREGGQLKAAGTFTPEGSTLESKVQMTELGLTSFQFYIERIAAVVIQSGAVSTQGTLRHGTKAAEAQTVYQGGFRVDNLVVTETGAKETLVGWKTLQTDELNLQLVPNRVEIGDVRVLQSAGKFIIEKDKSLNITNVIKSEAGEKKPASEAKAEADDPFPYQVRRILVSGGRVDFADLSLITPFGTKIHELKGTVSGITSAKGARAQVKLDGRVDEYGTAKVDGQLNTSDPKAFTDISIAFRNMEMSKLTPYSGQFAGRKIKSGKLTADLKYKINKKQLAGDNQLVVERLILGEKVESPQAVDLPLDLAVALLQDSNGVINLGLPVRGNLDAPEFNFGALIGKALAGLVTKIVTSPFRALGALLPGGGDEEAFKAVAFEPGNAEVPPPEKEKLAKLAVALKKRPQLRLTVQGRFNPDTDRAALRTASLGRSLADRLGQKLGPAEAPGPVDFNSRDTEKALEAMFKERYGADALKAVKADLKAEEEKTKKEAAAKAKGKDKGDAPEDEDAGRLAKRLFSLLADSEPIGAPELTRLAEARAQAVIAELTGPGGIAMERLGAQPSTALEKKDSASAALALEVKGS